MLGINIQNDYALLMIIVFYLRVSINDDLTYLEENKDLNKKRVKILKDLIAKRKKLINKILSIVDNKGAYRRHIIEKRVDKVTKEFLRVLKLSQKVRERKGIDEPYIDLDVLVYKIASELYRVRNKYQEIVHLTEELATNPLARKGENEEWVDKTIKLFISNLYS